jgi:hypothetical protein
MGDQRQVQDSKWGSGCGILTCYEPGFDNLECYSWLKSFCNNLRRYFVHKKSLSFGGMEIRCKAVLASLFMTGQRVLQRGNLHPASTVNRAGARLD